MNETERWWPEENHPVRSEWLLHLIANLLGPHLNHDLANLLSDAERMGLELSPDIERLRYVMLDSDGQSPKMLALFVSAAVLANEVFKREIEPLIDEGQDEVRCAYEMKIDVAKLIGDVAADAVRLFGFTSDTWQTFARSARPGSEPQWPPRGVAYRRHP